MGPLSLLPLILLLPAAPACAGDKEIVQLHGVFPDDATRDQGDYGACHSFASVAILENAIKRAGGDVKLSEADLFLRYTLRSDHYIELMGGWMFDEAMKDAYLKMSDRYVREGDNPSPEIEFALAQGVATRDSVPWAATMRYYDYYKRNLQALLDARIKECTETKTECAKPQANRSSYESYASYVKYLREGNKNPGQYIIPGEPATLQAERDATRKLLSGFKYISIIGPRENTEPGDACREKARVQRDTIAFALRGHAPVIVGMNLENLPAWQSFGGHAFVLTGFLRDADRYTFTTRNSWGGKNPDVPDDQLCHLGFAGWLMAPGGN